MRCRRMDGLNPSERLPCPVPSPPTCVAGSHGTFVSCSRNSQCANSPGGGQQNATERDGGDCSTAGTGVLQPSLSGAEVDRRMEACHRPLATQQLFVTITKFRMETVSSVLASVHRGDWMFSVDLQDAYFQILIHQEFCLYLHFCLEGSVYQFKALCFSLSMALQVFTRVFALVLEWAHRSCMRLLRYLDDWLVVSESRDYFFIIRPCFSSCAPTSALWSTGRSQTLSRRLVCST